MIAAKTTVKNPAVCPLVLKITNEIKKRAIGKMLLMHLAKDYLVGHKLASIPYKHRITFKNRPNVSFVSSGSFSSLLFEMYLFINL